MNLRESSPVFGHQSSAVLRAENKKQFHVLAGIGRAFLLTNESTEIQYKVDGFWSPEHPRRLR